MIRAIIKFWNWLIYGHHEGHAYKERITHLGEHMNHFEKHVLEIDKEEEDKS